MIRSKLRGKFTAPLPQSRSKPKSKLSSAEYHYTYLPNEKTHTNRRKRNSENGQEKKHAIRQHDTSVERRDDRKKLEIPGTAHIVTNAYPRPETQYSHGDIYQFKLSPSHASRQENLGNDTVNEISKIVLKEVSTSIAKLHEEFEGLKRRRTEITMRVGTAVKEENYTPVKKHRFTYFSENVTECPGWLSKPQGENDDIFFF